MSQPVGSQWSAASRLLHGRNPVCFAAILRWCRREAACTLPAMDTDRRHAPGHRALRKGRVSLPGQIYLVTAACHGRRKRFARFDCACAVARVLASPAAAGDARVLAWVLMPDHWHGLLQLGSVPLPHVLKRIHSLAARACNAADGRSGPVWSGAFHDRALRRDEDLRACAWYLANNPIRAGLVQRPHDYPFWNAIWL